MDQALQAIERDAEALRAQGHVETGPEWLRGPYTEYNGKTN